MPKKLTYEFVYNYFKEQDCELLETEYVNANTKIKYICKCGNESFITFGNFKKGSRCAKCSGNEKLTYEFVYNYFKEQKCELLETKYINNITKMKYLCICKNESFITFGNFQKSVRCTKCSGNEKLTYEYVYNYFKEQNCELLETEYTNALTKMRYICICKNISSIIFSNFQKGVRCMKCSSTEKLTYEYVYNYFKEQKCELLETEYINTKIKMKYICKCKNESSITFDSFQQGKRCKFCKNKTEKKLFSWLQKHNFNVDTQVKFDWCKKKRKLPYDFVIENLKIILELDGAQHFEQVSNWKSPEKTQKNDNLKNKLALKNGYRMIRICQQIVYSDKEDWENQLLKAINSKDKLIYIGSIYN
jgi:very-short-patch-repair endonuclease